MSFEIVKFSKAPRVCLSPFGARVDKNAVSFRISAELAEECNMKRGDTYALAQDHEAGLIALVADPKNETGYASKIMRSLKSDSLRCTIDFPRVDLLKQLFPKPAKLKGLDLFKDRSKGKVVFHAPEGRAE